MPASPRPSRAGRGRSRLSPMVLALVLLLVAAVALALWWWSLRSLSDPIDANPVSTTATVVSSPSCGEGAKTTVQLSGADPGSVSTLDGCGFAVGERLAVDYLAGSPESVRLTGTTRAGESPTITKVLPIVILVAGFASVAMLGFAAVGRRGRRPAAGAGGSGAAGSGAAPRSRRRRGGGPAVTVDDLRARIAAARTEGAGPAEDSAAAGGGAAGAGTGTGEGGSMTARGDTGPEDTVIDDDDSADAGAVPAQAGGAESDRAAEAGQEEGDEPDRLAE